MEANDRGLTLRVEQSDEGRTVVHVAGEVDMATVPALRECLGEVDGHVVVDLSGVTFLDSSGINVLVITHKRLALDGGSVTLRTPKDLVARTIEIVGLREWIEE
jgi:anti-sigma B factor antagonist